MVTRENITWEDFVTFNHRILPHEFSVNGFEEFNLLSALCVAPGLYIRRHGDVG